ncbi:MAG: hypothetical protein KGM97_07355 [Alphaproteobacteria bacterium]|nr:hypothetical protein [Alphaproteobacteria bacterium]MDE2630791.1 hypothetical protein [Alphaproteobacteria bacterium]
MKTRERAAQGLVVIGSLILVAAAALHDVTGYPGLVRALSAANLRPFLEGSFKAFWLLMSWHWIAIGVIALVVSYGGARSRKLVLLLCGLLPLVDGIGTSIAVGWFFGNEMLSLAGLVIVAAAALFESVRNTQA